MSEEVKQIEFDFMNNDNYVFKSNNLIESNYNLTTNEQRLVYLAIKKLKPKFVKSNVKPSELATYASTQNFGNIKIYVNEFKKEFGLSGNSFYERLSEASSSLYDRSFMYFNDKGNFVEKRWVITSEYDKNNNYISITFHPDLILDLLIFKTKYGKLQYNVSKYLNTNYSFRLYELLKNCEYKGERIMSVKEIRQKLEMDDKTYSDSYTFKINVIDKSIDLINKHSDIDVKYEVIRKGRRTDGFKFYITVKKDELALDIYGECPEEEHVININKIVGYNLTDYQINKITNYSLEAIKEFGVDMGLYDYVKEKVKIINEYAKNNKIKNFYGILELAIKNNWQQNIAIGKNTKGHFNDFEQRNYDFDEVEPKLLGWDKD